MRPRGGRPACANGGSRAARARRAANTSECGNAAVRKPFRAARVALLSGCDFPPRWPPLRRLLRRRKAAGAALSQPLLEAVVVRGRRRDGRRLRSPGAAVGESSLGVDVDKRVSAQMWAYCAFGRRVQPLALVSRELDFDAAYLRMPTYARAHTYARARTRNHARTRAHTRAHTRLARSGPYVAYTCTCSCRACCWFTRECAAGTRVRARAHVRCVLCARTCACALCVLCVCTRAQAV
jgi:hypothetical protein